MRRLVMGATVALAVVTASCGGGGDDGPEPLAYGKSATIGYEDANTKTATKIEVTVLGVRPGTVAELEAGGFNLDDDEKDASVLYVDAKYKNVGDQAVGKIGHVDIEDTKGERISSTIVINLGGDTFDKCPADNKGDLTPGAEHQHCSLFLVPKGRTAEWVRATDYTIADLPRVYWPVS